MRRWIPFTVLAALEAVTWSLFYSGGFRSISAWYLLIGILPLFGIMVLVALLFVVWLAKRRRRKLGITAPSRPAAGIATAALAVFALWPPAWPFQLWTIRYPYALSKTRPVATVRLPLDGPTRVVWGGDDLARNYHAASPDQRWAYDLAIDPILTGSSRLEDYGCYGKPVLAPLAGIVSQAHDGEPEQVPGKLVRNLKAPFGNHVVIKLPTDTFLVMAHLQTGSVLVHEGDVVREGQPIGRCGDSGNTSEPHVHIHHQRQDPRRFSVNYAEGLPLFFRDHDGSPMPQGGIMVRNGKAVPTGAVVRHIGARP
jgi:hypothetical protein